MADSTFDTTHSDRNLLFGILALQLGLVDKTQFDEARAALADSCVLARTFKICKTSEANKTKSRYIPLRQFLKKIDHIGLAGNLIGKTIPHWLDIASRGGCHGRLTVGADHATAPRAGCRQR
jgi:hypothetical protein